jgi:hypothetical protein
MAHYAKELKGIALQRGYVNATSRYAYSICREYTENRLFTYEIYKRKNRLKNGTEQFLEITPAVEFRPDLVAYEFYGTPELWWSILEFNGMKDILEFKAGKNILLPGNVMV